MWTQLDEFIIDLRQEYKNDETNTQIYLQRIHDTLLASGFQNDIGYMYIKIIKNEETLLAKKNGETVTMLMVLVNRQL